MAGRNPIGGLGRALFGDVGKDVADALGRKIGALPDAPFMAEVAAKSYTPKATARAARDQGLDISQNQVRQIRDLKAQRTENTNFTDPLVSAAATREFRTPTAIGQKNAADLEYHNNMLDRIMKAEDEQAARIATKDNLLFAAREARKLGYNVRKSTDKNGNVSSYYVETPSGDVRISDHELPYSPRRDFMATEHGQAGFSGFHGGELIVDQNTTLDDVLDTLIPDALGSKIGALPDAPKLKVDNPGGDWLQSKLQYAQEAREGAKPNTYRSTLGTGGGVTGYFREPVYINPNILTNIRGSVGEERYRPDPTKIRILRESIAESGYEESPILIHVREDGVPFVVEGNHRIIEGIESGRQAIPVEIKYLRGAEDVDGLLSPTALGAER